jgi:hypothetical protein
MFNEVVQQPSVISVFFHLTTDNGIKIPIVST